MKHSRTKAPHRPIGIDLFSGVGGMSLGFEQAGFDIVAAVEIDPIHAAAHLFNFPACTMIPQSVVGLTAKQIRQAAKIGDRPIDIVFGGAPCQGFSLIGQRMLEDPRNSLVREFVRLVCELEASYFVFENVKGLTVGRHRGFLDELIDAFHAANYQTRSPWKVLNAAEFGVPQRRERLFLIGARAGLPIPDYPPPITSVDGKPLGLPPAPTCQEALDDLPDADRFPALLESDEVSVSLRRTSSKYAHRMRCMSAGSWMFAHVREWDQRRMTSSMRTEHTPISSRRFAETPPGEVEPISRFFKLSPTGLANTLRAGTDSARGAFTSPRPIHYRFARCITVREMARLHGFPDWFRFHVTKWHGARQIGNAVPPPLAFAVARELMKVHPSSPCPSTTVMPLGDPSLLTMDMGEAAEFFSIPVPIRKRDRKSGSKKRKQEDIERGLTANRGILTYA